MPVPREIARLCSSLTIITAREYEIKNDYDNFKTRTQNITEIRLAHFSVKEYLVSDRVAEGFRDLFKQSRAEAEIVRVSLAYLFATALSSDVDSLLSTLPFAKFCARYWMKHARVAEQEEDIVPTWTTKALSESKILFLWLRLFDPDQPWKDEPRFPEFPGTPLYYASLGGLAKSVELLLDRGADINAQGGRYGNALQAASVRGHVEVVRLLLNRDADVNAQGGKYGNALQAASFQGYVEVVRLLLNRGADVNAQGGRYGNALQAASVEGYVEVVQLLLDEGADVNAQGGLYGNALQAASEGGHIEVVQLLQAAVATYNETHASNET
jgi:hypothetical protein